jgi:undecaprenyl-diphosphatase
MGRGITQPREWWKSDQGRLAVAIVVATIPTGIIGILLEHRVEDWAHQRWIVGACLLGTAAAVWSTRRGGGTEEIPSLRTALLIGIAQGLAVLPGLSRSGSTIALAMALGLSGPAAFRYSFLLSLPAVGGALLLELRKPGVFDELGLTVWLGAAVSLVVGIAALLTLRALIGRGKFWAFALYLVPVGLALIAWDMMRAA